MTFKTSAQRILAYVDSPLMQMSHKISEVTGPKFTKFIALIFFSSTMLMQQSMLRSVHPLSNERGDIKKTESDILFSISFLSRPRRHNYTLPDCTSHLYEWYSWLRAYERDMKTPLRFFMEHAILYFYLYIDT